MDLTFLISTYNRRDVLLRTLAELREVTRRSGLAAEVIVVDNASGDGTADAVAAGFPEVRLIRGATNRGACAKNAGLPPARGRVVMFLDDDSYPTSESLPRMLRHFAADPSLGAAIFDVRLPDGSRECSAYPNVCIGCGTAFRREALVGVGGLPDDYFMQAEEYDVSLRLLDAGWSVERFDDLLVHHLKTPGARVPTRTTRLDVRNNLTLIARRFPARHAIGFAIDWMRRYRWIAKSKGWRHEVAFWRGLGEGLLRAMRVGKRKPIAGEAFERFARLDEIRRGFERLAADGVRGVLLADLGKNARAYVLGARSAGVRVVAIADGRIASPGRRFRGVPVVDDASADRLDFDTVVVANSSPVHAAIRRRSWKTRTDRPVVDLLAGEPGATLAQAA